MIISVYLANPWENIDLVEVFNTKTTKMFLRNFKIDLFAERCAFENFESLEPISVDLIVYFHISIDISKEPWEYELLRFSSLFVNISYFLSFFSGALH